MDELHLLDLLAEAKLERPSPDHVCCQRLSIGRDVRMGLFCHPPAAVHFDLPAMGSDAVLELACGLKKACWDKLSSAVIFEVVVSTRWRTRRLLRCVLDPARRAEDRAWISHRIALGSRLRRDARLTLRTSVEPGGDSSYCWAGWAEPLLRGTRRAAPRPPSPSSPAGHLFLITADALRPDFLGCYGGSVSTPAIDRLAGEGWRVAHARAQTPTTLGSYASLMSGRYPQAHGVQAEYGVFAPGLPTLADRLRAAGFRTVLASSEADLSVADDGLIAGFDEHLPCFGQPAQSAAMTTRALLRRLDAGLDRRTFVWAQYFDAHPPANAPLAYRQLAYPGDPERERFEPERLAEIPGVEFMTHLRAARPLLARGEVPANLLDCLRQTRDRLRGEPGRPPDLYHHLLGLGPRAMGGRQPAGFADWLSDQLSRLEAGELPEEVSDWLTALEPLLVDEVERDILSWLEGVVDFRYPLRMCEAAVSYLDSEVGRLLDRLRALGIYDQSTVILTSPHGEAFGEAGVSYHHHALLECCLRVPLIIKPPGASPRVIEPVVDLIDLLPTLCGLLELDAPTGLDGRDLSAALAGGEWPAEHRSVAVELAGAGLTIVDGEHKLVRYDGRYRAGASWDWRPGEQALFDCSPLAPPACGPERDRRIDQSAGIECMDALRR